VRGTGGQWSCACDAGYTCTSGCGIKGGYADEIGFGAAAASTIGSDSGGVGATGVAAVAPESTAQFGVHLVNDQAAAEQGMIDVLLCHAQAVSYYGPAAADQMLADGLLLASTDSQCSDLLAAQQSQSASDGRDCELGTCYWGEAAVPYYVDGSEELAAVVDASVRELETRTNARFVKLSVPSGDYIQAVPSNQCGGVSVLGKAFGGGGQRLQAPTAADCGGNSGTAVGVTVHEIMHALGLFHEQARPDRDEHIIVNWQNIQGGESNFNYKKRSEQRVDRLNLPYDYNSIMHYSSGTFSNGQGPTMIAKNGKILGGKSLTPIDKAKINGLYPRQRHTCSVA